MKNQVLQFDGYKEHPKKLLNKILNWAFCIEKILCFDFLFVGV